ncbi:hypothetical protein EZV62_016295 [Acer yangbiense]|uniref:RNase H type-1 domain-containing protein n=1 Tax=Acer yangbiense TaxID=1000413 RepID=A0A5C7HQ62_9ROSI|nr:hypothetical protein EZV62_016295 [Acer yangbiense]
MVVVMKMLQKGLSFLLARNRVNAADDDDHEELMVAEDVKEGHFAVFAVKGEETQRFVVGLKCLTNPRFLRLLELAEEEYGFNQNGGLKVPYAAISTGLKKIGIAIIICDSEGRVMGSSTQCMDALFHPLIAEVTALFRGALFAVDAGLLPAVFESDAKAVVDLVNSGNASFADVGTIISDILRLLSCNNLSVSYVRRAANLVAHNLVQLSFSSLDDLFLLEDNPPSVEWLIQADVIS